MEDIQVEESETEECHECDQFEGFELNGRNYSYFSHNINQFQL